MAAQDEISLQLGGPQRGISVEGFLRFFENAIAALRELDKESSPYGSETIQWEITEASSKSPITTTIRGRSLVGGNGRHALEVIASFATGVGLLNHSNTRPPRFTKTALKHVKEMATIANRWLLTPVVQTESATVQVESTVAENADWAIKAAELEKPYYREYGSLSGTLKAVNAVTRKKDHVILVDRLTGDKTLCYVRGQQLESKVREGWKQRVVITGDIFVDRKTRKPRRVKVHDIRILPDQSTLLPVDALTRIEITGGIESAEYVRGLRDDE